MNLDDVNDSNDINNNRNIMGTVATEEKRVSNDSRNRKVETGGRETERVTRTRQQVPNRGLATWRPDEEIGVRVRGVGNGGGGRG